MFRDRPILETLELVAARDEWLCYAAIRHVDPPPLWAEGFPGQQAMFAAREQLEAKILPRVRYKLEQGDWVAIGRWNDGPTFDEIDRRLWSRLEFALPYGRVWMPRSEDFFSDVLVSQVRQPVQHSQKQKEQLRSALLRWFANREDAGDPPLPKSKWLTMAKADFPGLTTNLFNGVWSSLGHPHPLKIDGRPEG